MKTRNKNKVMIVIVMIVALAVVVVSYFFFANTTPAAGDYKKATYIIDDTTVSFEDDIQNGAFKYLADELVQDFDGNDRKDIAFLISRETATTTLYYLAVALNNMWTGYRGTNALYVGNQILPMTTEFIDGNIVVNYADRHPGESMAASPRFWYTKSFKIEDGELIRVKKI